MATSASRQRAVAMHDPESGHAVLALDSAAVAPGTPIRPIRRAIRVPSARAVEQWLRRQAARRGSKHAATHENGVSQNPGSGTPASAAAAVARPRRSPNWEGDCHWRSTLPVKTRSASSGSIHLEPCLASSIPSIRAPFDPQRAAASSTAARGPSAQLVRASLRRRDRRRPHLLLAARHRGRRDHRSPAPQHRPAHLPGRSPHRVSSTRPSSSRCRGSRASSCGASCTPSRSTTPSSRASATCGSTRSRAHVPPALGARERAVFEARSSTPGSAYRALTARLRSRDAAAILPDLWRLTARKNEAFGQAASRRRPRRRRSRPRAT